jgi:signal transduction histidine kinase
MRSRWKPGERELLLIGPPPATDAFVLGDGFNLRQVIFNLIDYALKYNQPEGLVNIFAQIENQSVIIQVPMPGSELPPRTCRTYFDRFFRVDKSRSRP